MNVANVRRPVKFYKTISQQTQTLNATDLSHHARFLLPRVRSRLSQPQSPSRPASRSPHHRFLSRVWRLFVDEDTGELRPAGETTDDARRALHVAIKTTTEGIEQLRFNTPVSKMMEFVNASSGKTPSRDDGLAFIRMLNPYAPHLAEELWQRMGCTDILSDAAWPAWDEAALVADTLEIAVQVMGKLRGTVSVAADADKDTILAAAKANANVAKWLDGKTIIKEIVVPGRLVNFVAK